jgi:SAM-dependent methyltransferase
MSLIPRDYGKSEYWELRYAKDKGIFDWYFDWEEFFPQNLAVMNIKPPVLVVGCGNSNLSMKLEASGIYPVVSIDISKTCCRHMASQYKGCYVPMDATGMQFRDSVFQTVLDKGTLDAVLCSDNYNESSVLLLAEIGRVLSPSGVFIEITFGKFEEMMKMLDIKDVLPWDFEKSWTVDSEFGFGNVLKFQKNREFSREKVAAFFAECDDSSSSL